MRSTTIGSMAVCVAVAAALLLAVPAEAAKKKKRQAYKSQDNSPSAIYARQQDARTFDETQYYERDSRKIPVGTAAWWRQLEFEAGKP